MHLKTLGDSFSSTVCLEKVGANNLANIYHFDKNFGYLCVCFFTIYLHFEDRLQAFVFINNVITLFSSVKLESGVVGLRLIVWFRLYLAS